MCDYSGIIFLICGSWAPVTQPVSPPCRLLYKPHPCPLTCPSCIEHPLTCMQQSQCGRVLNCYSATHHPPPALRRSCVPCIYYGFYHSALYCNAYLILMSVLGSALFVCTQLPFFYDKVSCCYTHRSPASAAHAAPERAPIPVIFVRSLVESFDCLPAYSNGGSLASSFLLASAWLEGCPSCTCSTSILSVRLQPVCYSPPPTALHQKPSSKRSLQLQLHRRGRELPT